MYVAVALDLNVSGLDKLGLFPKLFHPPLSKRYGQNQKEWKTKMVPIKACGRQSNCEMGR
jgi:hypothetical protein